MDVSSTASEKDVSDGLIRLLEPVVKQCDTRLESLLLSQAALSKQVDLFSQEISKFHEDKKVLHLVPYTAKLTASRKKLKKVEMMVMQTKDRIANISRMHNQLLVNEKTFMDKVEAQNKAAAEPTTAPVEGSETKTESKEEEKAEETPAEKKEDEPTEKKVDDVPAKE
eukprot:CAMPEP_0181321294 /NCGR_PEP_ID=MMETSP1101-20121128/18600_1 /TAXON_ID=46948 /ORGANISM="Rhodomonas abbreviata, Strain Caron Lab Isolate" /LENGTH=167 /DNA_ID=CAMNT_0023429095 /DNA_START=18 /DNA_END=521 /DNA_ORIENTATION=+